MRYVLAALAALVLCGSAVAQDDTGILYDVGVGWSYSAFLVDGGDIVERNIAAFAEVQVPVGKGQPSGEWDIETGEEIFYPDWYLGVGYTVQADEDPLSGLFVIPYRRIPDTDFFVGVGGQFEIWGEQLFGETFLAPGGRLVLETPGLIEGVPMRLTASVARANETNRFEIGLTGIR